MAAMPNNEHLPIFRDLDGTGHSWGWQCSCGHIDRHIWVTYQGAVTAWLEHVVNASLRAAGLGGYALNSPIDLVRSV